MTDIEKRCEAITQRIDAYKAKKYREGYSKDDVAEKLGLSYNRLAKLLRESPQSITLAELTSIARGMNMSVITLIGG